MSDKVVPLSPEFVGEGFRFDADQVLEEAKGKGLRTVAVLAETEDGELWVSGSANAGETMILMEKAKHFIIHGSSG